MRNLAIIGGTGVGSLEGSEHFERLLMDTPFGQALMHRGEMAGNMVAFLTRHGPGHKVAPHKVNYRANIWALKSLGVEEIFATTATGSCNRNMEAGHFVVCDQLLDFTKGRINTFYDNPDWGVAHADFTNPYCETQRRRIIRLLEGMDIPFHRHGTYVCTEGPRFETAAEVKMFAILGGDVLGMTGAQGLRHVELPAAFPIMMGGLRSTVLQVASTATLAAYTADIGLGRFLFAGMKTNHFEVMIGGAIVVVLLTLILDIVLAALQRAVARRTKGMP